MHSTRLVAGSAAAFLVMAAGAVGVIRLSLANSRGGAGGPGSGTPSLVERPARAGAVVERASADGPAPRTRSASRGDATGAIDIPREVQPAKLLSCEEFWEAQGPIFVVLPHMRRDDATKLPYFCPGDFDKNDSVDADDVALFLAAWRDGSHPLSHWTDVTGDGTIDQDDLDAFMTIYQAGGCNPVEARDYRDVIC